MPLPGAAGPQAAQLPGQAAHCQGDRAGEDEEDGGTEPGPGGDFQRGARAGDVEKILRDVVFFRSCRWLWLREWKSRINPPGCSWFPAQLCWAAGLSFLQEFWREIKL